MLKPPQRLSQLGCPEPSGGEMPGNASVFLERDNFSSNRHLALPYCWSMIFSENRYPLFGIML